MSSTLTSLHGSRTCRMGDGSTYGGAPDVRVAFHDEARLVEALRLGDEAAFLVLVERYHVLMVHLALNYVSEWSVAEEVAQEAWLGVLHGIGSFQAPSSLKTWILCILVNQAKTRAKRDMRGRRFSTACPAEPSVAPMYFQDDGPDREHWRGPPQDWSVLPEEQLLSKELRSVVSHTVDALPAVQRTVIILRDIDGWSPAEVCSLLGISETNQRVILHRAR